MASPLSPSAHVWSNFATSVRRLLTRPVPSHNRLGLSAQSMRTRARWASAMSRGRLEKARWENTASQAAIWLWTTERHNRNAPNVPTLPQEIVSQVEQAACQPKTRSRSPRRPPLLPLLLATPLPRILVAECAFCDAFNRHETGCSTDGKCQNSDLHICNYPNPEGVLCGATASVAVCTSCLYPPAPQGCA